MLMSGAPEGDVTCGIPADCPGWGGDEDRTAITRMTTTTDTAAMAHGSGNLLFPLTLALAWPAAVPHEWQNLAPGDKEA